ncbi:MAG: hypothetical protein R6V40_00195 [Candidatus Moraniibacteriota bacterium]
MKKSFFYVSLAALIIFSISFLYYQEKKQRTEAGNKYTITTFSTTKNNYNPENKETREVFNLLIENSSEKEQQYNVALLKNDSPLGNKKVKIPAQSRKIIEISDDTAQKITRDSRDSFKYEAKISWNDNSRSIYKKIYID